MMVNINCHQKIMVRGCCARTPGKGTLTITEANGDISDRKCAAHLLGDRPSHKHS